MVTSANTPSINSVKETTQRAVVTLLNDHIADYPVKHTESEVQIITDNEHGHYQLVIIDWDDNFFRYYTIFHFDIKPDGKIWIQVNNTDVDIAAELVERGVAKSDIVIGFQPPRYRPYTGYAVA